MEENKEIKLKEKTQNNAKIIKKDKKKSKKLSKTSKYFDFYDDIKSGCHKIVDWQIYGKINFNSWFNIIRKKRTGTFFGKKI